MSTARARTVPVKTEDNRTIESFFVSTVQGGQFQAACWVEGQGVITGKACNTQEGARRSLRHSLRRFFPGDKVTCSNCHGDGCKKCRFTGLMKKKKGA